MNKHLYEDRQRHHEAMLRTPRTPREFEPPAQWRGIDSLERCLAAAGWIALAGILIGVLFL